MHEGEGLSGLDDAQPIEAPALGLPVMLGTEKS